MPPFLFVAMNEFTMQNIMANYLLFTTQHEFVTCNVAWMYSWECDLISINNGMVYEYEIKVSKSDFKQDLKKKKHNRLENGCRWNRLPNYFTYVINGFDVDLNELPKYAGLIVIENNIVKRIKRAPKLHDNKYKDYDFTLLLKGISIRYWKLRNLHIQMKLEF